MTFTFKYQVHTIELLKKRTKYISKKYNKQIYIYTFLKEQKLCDLGLLYIQAKKQQKKNRLFICRKSWGLTELDFQISLASWNIEFQFRLLCHHSDMRE